MHGLKFLLPFAFVACASTSEVVVKSDPNDSAVYLIDPKTGKDALIGKTPLTFSRNEYAKTNGDVLQLRVDKEGYESKYTAIASFPGQTTFVDIKLNNITSGKAEVREAFEASRLLTSEANNLLLQKRYSEALGKVDKILSLDPKNANAFAARGSILYLMKDYEHAEQAWIKALELDPSLESVRSSLLELNMKNSEQLPSTSGGQNL